MRTHRRRDALRKRSAAALVLALLAVGCGGGSSVPTPVPSPPSFQPTQAVLYDGWAADSPALVMAFPGELLEFDFGAPGVPCVPDGHASPGGILSVGPGTLAVYGGPSGFGAAYFAHLAKTPAGPPVDIAAFKHDCDLAANLATVQAYLAQLQADAAALMANVEACAALAEVLYCQVIAAVEAATIQTFDHPTYLPYDAPFLAPQSPSGSGIESQFGCDRFLTRVEHCRWLVEMITREFAHCEDLDSVLGELLASIGPILTLEDRAYALIDADHARASSAHLLGNARRYHDELEGVIARFVPAHIQAACAQCELDFVHVPPSPNGAMTLIASRVVLDGIVQSLAEAALDPLDPPYSARLAQAIARIRAIPAHRTVHATYRWSLRVGSHFVALRDPGLPDNGHCPLAVVITALPVDAPLPAPNASDFALLDFALRAFADALAPKTP